MTFNPLIPMWIVLVMAVLGAAVLIHVYRRVSLPALLRAFLLFGMLIMLANPTRALPVFVPRPRTLAIVTDCSGSMALTDTPDKQSRGALARAAAIKMSGDLGPGWRVVRLGLGGELLAPPPTSDAGDSNFTALGEIANLTPKPDAAIFISDGADWAGGDPETALVAAGILVHTLGVGSARTGANTSVELLVPSPNLTPGQEVSLSVVVSATADLTGRSVELVVEAVDDVDHPIELLRGQITLTEWKQFAIPTNVGPTLGGRRWRARLQPVPDEITTIDNTAWASAQVVDRMLHLLVLEGRPCWDTTFAVRAWRRDRQLQVATSYQIGSTPWRSGTLDIPPTALSLRSIDVLVVGQGVEQMLPSKEVLAAWIDAGGRLILLGTSPLPQCQDFDPLIPNALATSVIVDGGDADGLLPANLHLSALSAPATLAPQARVLLGERLAPRIASKRIGAGAVCRVNLDGFWRWHLTPVEGRAAAGANRELGERFCRQLLRSISRTPSGDLWAERLRIPVGDSVALWTRPDSGLTQLEHTLPDGSRTTLKLADYGARPRLDQPGCHRFSSGGKMVTVIVEQRLGEQVNAGRNDARLIRLAERTGGEAHDLSEADAVAKRLATQRTLAALPDALSRTEPLITERWWLWLLVGIVASEWWLRRRKHGVV